MDCYSKVIYKLLNISTDSNITVEFVSFISNYTITEFWMETTVAKSFDVPIISSTRIRYGFQDLQTFFPNIKKIEFDNFIQYSKFLKNKIATSKIIVRLDRFYLDYIQPRAKMGAHFILILEIDDDKMVYFDAFDEQIHRLSIKDFKIATCSSAPGNLGLVAIYNAANEIIITKQFNLKKSLENRINYLLMVITDLQSYSQNNIKNNHRLNKLFIKVNLQNIIESDFLQHNSRLENYHTFKLLNETKLANNLFRVAKLYYRLAIAFFSLLRLTTNRTFLWRLYLKLYILLLKKELKLYKNYLEVNLNEKNWEILL